MFKRWLFAKTMQMTGVTRLLEALPEKPGLLIITHHRIGDPSTTRFDRGVFTATAEELNKQVAYLRRHTSVLDEASLHEIVSGARPLDRLYTAITFDDGYLDNYTHAFTVLRDHGCPGFFFLVSEYVGTGAIPWWDAIAYLVRNSPHSTLRLRIPVEMEISLTGDREAAIYSVLQCYKRPDNSNGTEFMNDLEHQAGIDLPKTGRRFLDWKEAAEMQAAGMCMGAHTLTHRILSQLSRSDQEYELTGAKKILEQRLGKEIGTFAYPVGIPTSFTPETQEIARAAGYKVCLSFYGGVNQPGSLVSSNLLRTRLEPETLIFRNQLAFRRRLGRMPY